MTERQSAGRTQWVLFSHRLPREPSTRRIALWRKLKRLGVAQMADGVVALPHDARTLELLEWLADEVHEVGGDAGVWLATPTTKAQERSLIDQMVTARAAEYADLTSRAERATVTPEVSERRRTLRKLRDEWRRIGRRDYFPPPERERARTALAQLSDTVDQRPREEAAGNATRTTEGETR